MPYTDMIKSASEYLFECQKDDGGIAFSNRNDALSGVWTTAEVLEAMLLHNQINRGLSTLDELIHMVQYLLNKFIICKDGTNTGYWEDVDGNGPSTTSTGHTIYSLQTFSNIYLENSKVSYIEFDIDESIDLKKLKQRIRSCIEKGINWLLDNQQADKGWCWTEKNDKEESKVLCTFYVLKGMNAIGSNENSRSVEKACLFIKETIEDELNRKVEQLNEKQRIRCLAYIMYGYIALLESKYLKQGDINLKDRIMNYIKHNCKNLSNYIDSKKIQERNFVYNIPYIALNVFLRTEEYTFKNEIVRLLDYFQKQKDKYGYWEVEKNGIKETTWVTAEAMIVLSLAQSNYIKFKNNVLMPQKQRRLKKILLITTFTTSVLLSILIWHYLFLSFTNYEINPPSTFSIISAVFSGFVSVVGFISSIITLVEHFKK